MTISLAGSQDVGELRLLLDAQLREHSIDIDDASLERAVRGVIEEPRRGDFLLLREGQLLGFAYLAYTWTLEHAGACAWLEELYVVPAARDRGYGTRLLRAAVQHAKKRGCAAIDLEVEAEHARVENLYEREGFRSHRRKRWYLKLS